VITYGTALLAGVVAESLHIHGLGSFAFVTAAIFAFVGLLIVFLQSLIDAVEEMEEKGARQQKVLGYAHSVADGWMLSELKVLTAVKAGAEKPKILAPANPMTAIDGLVNAAYAVLLAHYGQAERLEDRIDFEVTYMTRSHADEEITIAAWANQDGRKPTSMQQRKQDSTVYDRTVTADLYRDPQPSMRIVEDTSDPTSQYAELYGGQKERIRSSIVYPVLSSDYELLGTLVLHCDRAGFFRTEDRKFWREFCEIFAKRIALEVLLLASAVEARGDEERGAKDWPTQPY
jgi:GAF domain